MQKVIGARDGIHILLSNEVDFIENNKRNTKILSLAKGAGLTSILNHLLFY